LEETKCSTKAQNVFKNVNAVDKDQTFDTDVYERKQREGASDKMAETMEICTKDAEAASKTCQSSAGDDAAASSSCAAILGNALQECAEAGMQEYAKLTGEKIDETGLKTMKEESVAKEVGELAMTCSNDAERVYEDCEGNAGTDCKNAKKQAMAVCREASEKVMAEKQFGKNFDDLTDADKIKLSKKKDVAASKRAINEGKSCRVQAAEDNKNNALSKTAAIKACELEEQKAYFAAKNIDAEDLDSEEKKRLTTEYREQKETRGSEATSSVMNQCVTDADAAYKHCQSNAGDASAKAACVTQAKQDRVNCENKGKAAYEEATGITIDPIEYREKQKNGAAEDVSKEMMNCATEAFKFADTASREAKIAECDEKSKDKLRKAMGIFEDDVKSGRAKVDFDKKYNKIKKQEAQKKVAETMKAASSQTKIVNGVTVKLTKIERKQAAKEVMKKSLGRTDVTDTELETAIINGANDAVKSTKSSCIDSYGMETLDDQAKRNAYKECTSQAKKSFIAARMYDDVEDILDIKEKEKKEREIEIEYRAAKKKGAYEKAMEDMEAANEQANEDGEDITTDAFKTKQRQLAFKAFELTMDDGETVRTEEEKKTENEKLLRETAKKKASSSLDACYDVAMTVASSMRKAALANCRKEALVESQKARVKIGTQMADNEFAAMSKEIAAEKTFETMEAAMEADKDMSEEVKYERELYVFIFKSRIVSY
jgi:hypothetical protein